MTTNRTDCPSWCMSEHNPDESEWLPSRQLLHHESTGDKITLSGQRTITGPYLAQRLEMQDDGSGAPCALVHTEPAAVFDADMMGQPLTAADCEALAASFTRIAEALATTTA